MPGTREDTAATAVNLTARTVALGVTAMAAGITTAVAITTGTSAEANRHLV